MKAAKFYLASILPTVVYGIEPKDLTTLHCEENGGILKLREFGRLGIGDWGDDVLHLCTFDDGSVCETGSFYDGKCEKGDVQEFSSFCTDNGGQVVPTQGKDYQEEQGEEEWYEIISTQHWCIFKDDGTACSENTMADYDRYGSIDCDRVVCRVEEPPYVENWQETLCEVLKGEWVERRYPWDTIDGKPPTEQYETCAFEGNNAAFVAALKQVDREGSWGEPDGSFHEEDYYMEAFDGMFDRTSIPEDDGSCKEFREFVKKEVFEIKAKVAKDKCEEIGGIELLQKYDEHGDIYSLCNFGDKVCDILSTLDSGFEDCKITALPPFSEACNRFGGELTSVVINWDGQATPEYYLCDFPGRMFGMMGYYEECTENLYYHHDCRLPGTAFPFDGPPTISMPCGLANDHLDEFFTVSPSFRAGDRFAVNAARRDEDGLEYAVCVNDGNPKVSCFQWEMRTPEPEWNAGEEELWYCSDPYGPRGRYWLKGGPAEFSEYCVEEKQLGGVSFTGQLTYQGELPVCTFPGIDQAVALADYYHPSLEDDTVCTERFYYDNGGCLPYDVRGAEPPYDLPSKAPNTLPFHQLGVYLCGLLTGILLFPL